MNDQAFRDGQLVMDTKQELVDEILRLRAALEFYSDPFEKHDDDGYPIHVPEFYSEMDFGSRALEALNPK